MKYSFLWMTMILLGLGGVVIIVMFESITLDNDSEYYTLKEATEAAMLESIDRAYYTMSDGKFKISEQKFIENFTRRFAKSVSGDVDSYTLTFYDIIESPPKVSLSVKSSNGDYKLVTGEDDINIYNNISGILEVVD